MVCNNRLPLLREHGSLHAGYDACYHFLPSLTPGLPQGIKCEDVYFGAILHESQYHRDPLHRACAFHFPAYQLLDDWPWEYSLTVLHYVLHHLFDEFFGYFGRHVFGLAGQGS